MAGNNVGAAGVTLLAPALRELINLTALNLGGKWIVGGSVSCMRAHVCRCVLLECNPGGEGGGFVGDRHACVLTDSGLYVWQAMTLALRVPRRWCRCCGSCRGWRC